MKEKNKLFIGTANFGENYGLIKKTNVLAESDVKKIINKAIESPDLFVDTAKSYKNSEFLIGKYGANKLNNKIVTKIRLTKEDNYKSVVNMIEESLCLVKQDIFFSVLIHNAGVFQSENAELIIEALEDCKLNGLTQNIGVSCYTADEISFISSRFNSLNNFQIPENAIDQRNLNNRNFKDLHKSKKSLYIRSVFLQGALLEDPKQLPKFFTPEIGVFYDFGEICHKNGITRLKGCLDYIRAIDWQSGLVIGVQSENQLNEIIYELNNPVKLKIFNNPVLSQLLVDPRKWNHN